MGLVSEERCFHNLLPLFLCLLENRFRVVPTHNGILPSEKHKHRKHRSAVGAFSCHSGLDSLTTHNHEFNTSKKKTECFLLLSLSDPWLGLGIQLAFVLIGCKTHICV